LDRSPLELSEPTVKKSAEDFDWGDERSVIITDRVQAAIAVYPNEAGDLVIRQQAHYLLDRVSISRRSSSRCTSSPVSPTTSSRRPPVGQRRATRNTSGIRAGPIPAFRSRQRPSGGIRRTYQYRHHHVETRPPPSASADSDNATANASNRKRWKAHTSSRPSAEAGEYNPIELRVGAHLRAIT
jgi:hypothetical protein